MVTLGSGLLGASTTRQNPLAGGGIGAWEPGQSFEVPCETLRGFVERLKLEDPLFIKMDVEGSEEDILEDLDFFRQRQPILYLEQHSWWWKDERDCRRKIAAVEQEIRIIS
jgi:FkbM family methyltransferase